MFEGHQVMGPKNPDSYLKFHYGDYMRIPPENKREIHISKIEIL